MADLAMPMAENSSQDAPDTGIRPARQRRSRATREALLNAGVDLMRQRPLSEISIAEIATAAGASVGAFYSRFTSKEGYFAALQARQLEESAARTADRLAPERLTGLGRTARVRLVVRSAVTNFRELQGLIYTSIKRETAEPGAWTPMYENGVRNADRIVDCLLPVMPVADGVDAEFRIRVMVQVLYGTLVNAVLHRPPPLALADDRLIDELAVMADLYLRG